MSWSSIQYCFSSNYTEAREKFLAAASAARASVYHYVHPLTGADGEQLATDVAAFGASNARKTLVLVSGTHGVEGFCGSAIQLAHIRSGLVTSNDDIAILMVHALNPYGFAYKRRVTEENVDLNRNFLSAFDLAAPNEGYRKLHHILTSGPDAFSRFRRRAALALYLLIHGQRALQAAITSGQYQYRDGLFFAGTRASWAKQTWESILREHLAPCPYTLLIDYHTGLGRKGAGELISPLALSCFKGWRARVLKSFGNDAVRSLVAGDSVSTNVAGDLLSFTAKQMGEKSLGLFLEFGTVPAMKVLDALIDENWAHHHLTADHEFRERLKQRLFDVFNPDDDNWRASVWENARSTTQTALKCLAQIDSTTI